MSELDPKARAARIMHRASVFRLYPTTEQAETMSQIVGACRFVYNLCLEQRRDWYRPGRKINFASQCREITELRAEVDWLQAAPADALHQVARDLDQAFQNWWRGTTAYPKHHRRGTNDSFRIPNPDNFRLERSGATTGVIKIPKVGLVKLRGWRPLPGETRSLTIKRQGGFWFASVLCRKGGSPLKPGDTAIGIDLGVSAFAALSNGVMLAPINAFASVSKRIRRAQRSVSRKRKGSANRLKAIRKMARLHLRARNARSDFLHKHSTTIAKNHGMVAVEALAVRNMTASASGKGVRQKAGLNRSILDQGWRTFRTMLAYKLEERGGVLVEVQAAYTSQTCSACGSVDAANRKTQARFACISCGHEANADTNAAINILRRADSAFQPVEGQRGTKRPEEAGTSRRTF